MPEPIRWRDCFLFILVPMSEKGMYQLLMPFIAVVLVFVGFYVLGFVFSILGAVSDLIFDSFFLEGLFESLTDFFYILRDGNMAGIVVSILAWMILTIVGEIWITLEFDQSNK